MIKVRIVSYEDVNAWILGKFARKLNEELRKLGIDSDITREPDPTADINHHIIYTYCDAINLSGGDTLMITHVDEINKINLLRKQLSKAGLGICMSKATMNELIGVDLPEDKLCYISPAHDNVIKPRKIVIGITSKVQPTGSKREDIVARLADTLHPQLFEFVIMGSGWEPIISSIRKKGLSVTYYDQFDYDRYIKIIPSFDYYLYPGQDEGSMGFIDALAGGVKTIVTPQGFHLDAPEGIVHPFDTAEELIRIFEDISATRLNLVNAVSDWTWPDYAAKHLEVWNYLLTKKSHKSLYRDGLNSLISKTSEIIDVKDYKRSLYAGSWRRFSYVNWRRLKKLGNPTWVMHKIRSKFKKNKQ